MAHKSLTPRELRVWQAFQGMGEDVLARVGRDLAQDAGLSGPEFGVLWRLEGKGTGAMRQQELAEAMGWEKSRLSHQLTRMQERGLIERRQGDTRAVSIVLTRAGRRLLETARPVHAEAVRRHLLSRLSDKQAGALLRVSGRLSEDE